jgi:hypothetical protein
MSQTYRIKYKKQNVPKSIFKITERDKAKSIPITHMTVHFPGLVHVLQLKSGGVQTALYGRPPLFTNVVTQQQSPI